MLCSGYTEMGERIKAYRIKNGLTLEKAAERLGVSVTTTKLFERGSSLTLDNVMKICQKYGCTFAEIFPDEFFRYTSPFANMLFSTDEKQREAMRNVLDRTEKRC